jgi:mRNA interferase MazF
MVDFNPARGSEQAGVRPAVIVSNDTNNQHAPIVVVCAITKTVPEKRYPQNVHLDAGRPLPLEGTILGNQLYTIAKDRLGGFRGDLEPDQVNHLNHALRVALGV